MNKTNSISYGFYYRASRTQNISNVIAPILLSILHCFYCCFLFYDILSLQNIPSCFFSCNRCASFFHSIIYLRPKKVDSWKINIPTGERK